MFADTEFQRDMLINFGSSAICMDHPWDKML